MPKSRRGGKRLCTFSGCTRALRSRGLCITHYWQRWAGKELTPVTFHGKNLTPKIRFDRLWRLNQRTGCWEWEGSIAPRGYGQFWWSTTVGVMRAHRAAWLLYNGEIPDDPHHVYRTMGVLHVCDNPRCVNPDHLFLGTHRENVLDHIQKHGSPKHPGQRGERHPQAKLTEAAVRAIRASSASQSALGRQYGVSRGTIGEVKRREIWTHVKDEESC